MSHDSLLSDIKETAKYFRGCSMIANNIEFVSAVEFELLRMEYGAVIA